MQHPSEIYNSLVKVSGQRLSFDIFWYIYNKNKLYYTWTVDPDIYSILIVYKRVWDYLLHNILCMIFEKKKFSHDIFY